MVDMRFACYDFCMCPAVQIRDVPEDVHRELRARAAAAGMSLSDYLREEIVRLASHPPVAEVIRRAGMQPGGASPEAITAAIRAHRDA